MPVQQEARATDAIGDAPHHDAEVLTRRVGVVMLHVPVAQHDVGGPPVTVRRFEPGDRAAQAQAFERHRSGAQQESLDRSSVDRLVFETRHFAMHLHLGR
jgi:hypothetical protein